MAQDTINFAADVLDVRDIIARWEYLENNPLTEDERLALGVDPDTTLSELTPEKLRLAKGAPDWASSELDEFVILSEALEELKGSGGDEQWRGDWYPITLIAQSYFEDYAEELATETGAISSDAKWPLSHIDWEAAAEELKIDYSSIEIEGNEFWYR